MYSVCCSDALKLRSEVLPQYYTWVWTLYFCMNVGIEHWMETVQLEMSCFVGGLHSLSAFVVSTCITSLGFSSWATAPVSVFSLALFSLIILLPPQQNSPWLGLWKSPSLKTWDRTTLNVHAVSVRGPKNVEQSGIHCLSWSKIFTREKKKIVRCKEYCMHPCECVSWVKSTNKVIDKKLNMWFKYKWMLVH